MKQVEMYTDGACRGNPGPGGWGVWMRSGAHQKELFGAEPATTNNRMELTAAIKGLEALRTPCRVDLHTDSEYLRKGITEWLPRWKVNGWRTSSRKAVKNDDLWRQLDSLVAGHAVDWHWVRGHSGNPGNERADGLANRAIDELVMTGRFAASRGG